MLHDAAVSLCVPLAMLFRKSLDEGEVPSERKLATVVPIFKKGNKQDPGNYWPIGLTSITCKVLDLMVKDAVLDHIGCLVAEYSILKFKWF